MNKRQKTKLVNQLKRLETKLGKKRDEIRVILDDYKGIVNSFEEADDNMEGVVQHMRAAREELESAADKMSELV
jgi:predicted  nucleic acid-binding Zn-ribbon protein